MVYFVSLSIITIIELKVSYITGSFKSSSLTIKSIIILSHSNSSTGANYICLYLVCRTILFCWQYIYSLIYCLMCARSFGAAYLRPRSSIILDTLE